MSWRNWTSKTTTANSNVLYLLIIIDSKHILKTRQKKEKRMIVSGSKHEVKSRLQIPNCVHNTYIVTPCIPNCNNVLSTVKSE